MIPCLVDFVLETFLHQIFALFSISAPTVARVTDSTLSAVFIQNLKASKWDTFDRAGHCESSVDAVPITNDKAADVPDDDNDWREDLVIDDSTVTMDDDDGTGVFFDVALGRMAPQSVGATVLHTHPGTFPSVEQGTFSASMAPPTSQPAPISVSAPESVPVAPVEADAEMQPQSSPAPAPSPSPAASQEDLTSQFPVLSKMSPAELELHAVPSVAEVLTYLHARIALCSAFSYTMAVGLNSQTDSHLQTHIGTVFLHFQCDSESLVSQLLSLSRVLGV
jgi:hypothetical protein